jgi:hypothetical protein
MVLDLISEIFPNIAKLKSQREMMNKIRVKSKKSFTKILSGQKFVVTLYSENKNK